MQDFFQNFTQGILPKCDESHRILSKTSSQKIKRIDPEMKVDNLVWLQHVTLARLGVN